MPAPAYGFLGAGRMATALARGFVRAGLARGDQLVAFDPLSAAAEAFAGATGGHALGSNRAVVEAAPVVFLAVKPQQAAEVLADIGPVCRDRLLVSVAAGVSLDSLQAGLGAAAAAANVRLVRVMPNTPCLVGEGASGYALGPGATADDAALVERLLSSVGRAVVVPEKLLDAVTGLSGSGPAYVYLMIEALSDGGVRMGLPRDAALALAAQTVLGAARMVLETRQHPGALKDQVTSPGGTTIAGLQVLENAGVRGALMSAVEAATRRSHELAEGARPAASGEQRA